MQHKAYVHNYFKLKKIGAKTLNKYKIKNLDNDSFTESEDDEFEENEIEQTLM